MRKLQFAGLDGVRTDVGLEVAVWSENYDSQVRRAAAYVLAKLGKHAASAVLA